MKIVLEAIGGNGRPDLERAREEIIRVLGFRGTVSNAKVEKSRVAVEFEVNPKWDLPPQERIDYLREWMPAKVKSVFRVVDLSL
jgi:hypothetical protein